MSTPSCRWRVATGAATFVGRWFFGDQPAFQVPTIVRDDPARRHGDRCFSCTRSLGGVVGVAAAGFIRGLHLVEDAFDKIPWRYLRHMLGMLLVGVLMYALFRSLRPVLRRRRRLRDDRRASSPATPRRAWLLGLLFVCKLLATSLSLGSGSSGGIFSPSLFMGATLGGGFAALLATAGLHIRSKRPGLRHGRHGRDGRRRHRRGDDRRHHDLRDDARLRHRHADDPGRRHQRRRAPAAVAREHLHAQTGPARAHAAEGAARQHVPGAPRAGGHGPRRAGAAGRSDVRRVSAATT